MSTTQNTPAAVNGTDAKLTKPPAQKTKTARVPAQAQKAKTKGPVFDNARITAAAKQARTVEQMATASGYTLDGRFRRRIAGLVKSGGLVAAGEDKYRAVKA